jgi:hypothetical protein
LKAVTHTIINFRTSYKLKRELLRIVEKFHKNGYEEVTLSDIIRIAVCKYWGVSDFEPVHGNNEEECTR